MRRKGKGGKSGGANPQQKFFEKHNKKTKHTSWNSAIQGFGQYNIGKEKQDWLEIARAINCDFPVDVGHGSGGSGDFDQHVNLYLDGYITYIVKPACERAYGFSGLGKVKKELNIA